MSLYLGVDGGGTKTALALIDGTGGVLAQLRAPTCYYLEAGTTEGPAMVTRVLGEAVGRICADAGIETLGIDFSFVGLPGYGEVSGDLATLDALPATVLGSSRYVVDNDMVCGWAGSLGLTDGINVVCGTGSICYGRCGERSARVGGWGELIGDEGSGYWIGVRGLQAASRMSDGRFATGPLLAAITEELRLPTPLDLVDVVHNRWAGDRGRIAALTPVVVRAAEAGDAVAAGILTQAAIELVDLVETTRNNLGFASDRPVPLSCSGGVFSARPVADEFARLITAAGRYELRPPLLSPVLGAAAYAAELSGSGLSSEALQRLARGGR